MYPVLTTLIMMLFFKEKKSGWRIAAIASAVAGVYFLSGGDTKTGSFSFLGLFIVLLSALGYALYLVTMSQLKIGQMKGLLLTFYVFLFGGILLFIGTETISQLQPISEWHTAGNLILLALSPTVVSNRALVRAVKSIGSTLTSVLGAMEPVTAVCVGIFGENAFDKWQTGGNDVDCFAGYDAIQLLEEKVSEIMRVWCDLFSCD